MIRDTSGAKITNFVVETDVLPSLINSGESFCTKDTFIANSIISKDNEILSYSITKILNLNDVYLGEFTSDVKITLSTDTGVFLLQNDDDINSSYTISNDKKTISYTCSLSEVENFLSLIKFSADSQMEKNAQDKKELLSKILLTINENGPNRSATKEINIFGEDVNASVFQTNNNEYSFVLGSTDLTKDSFIVKNYHGNNFLLYEGDEIVDADKEYFTLDDANMCWAATDANMLAWTGWGAKGLNLEQNDNTEDAIFQVYADNFPNMGGTVDGGIQWFFSDETWNWLIIIVPHDEEIEPIGRGHYISETTRNYLEYINFKDLNKLYKHLLAGNAIGLTLVNKDNPNDGGHGVSCWGISFNPEYDINNPNWLKGIYITDNNDYQSNIDQLVYIPLEYTDNHYNFKNYYYNFQISGIHVLLRNTSLNYLFKDGR